MSRSSYIISSGIKQLFWKKFSIYPLITDGEKLASLGFLVAGIILLLAAQDVFSFSVNWKVILAVFLIVAGFNIIVKDSIASKNTFYNKDDKEVEEKTKNFDRRGESIDSQIAIFSGSDRVYRDEVFLWC